MKANIEVKDRREADAIRTGLEDPAVRAFVIIIGVLMELPSDRARARVLQYVTDRIDDDTSEQRARQAQTAGDGNSAPA